MKKIRVWKVIILSVVTLGIYQLFWLAIRRRELINKTKLHVPHIAWLIVPPVLAVVLPMGYLIVGVTLSMLSDGLTEPNHILVTFLAIMALFLTAFAISCWWIWKFGKAVEKVTNGRVTAGWSLAYWFILGPAMVFMHQYFFNRMPLKGKQRPTNKFIIWSIVAMTLSVLTTPLSLSSLQSDFETVSRDSEALDASLKEYNDKYKKSQRLYAEYNSCVKALEADYPEETLTNENIDAYNMAYDRCEEIRVLQYKAADEADAAGQNIEIE